MGDVFGVLPPDLKLRSRGDIGIQTLLGNPIAGIENLLPQRFLQQHAIQNILPDRQAQIVGQFASRLLLVVVLSGLQLTLEILYRN